MPAVTPVTSPPVEVTVALAVFVLVHVPPAGAPVRVVVEPMQVAPVPVMPVGSGLTENTDVRVQPVESV